MRFTVVALVLNDVTVYAVQDTGVDSDLPTYAGLFGSQHAAQDVADAMNSK